MEQDRSRRDDENAGWPEPGDPELPGHPRGLGDEWAARQFEPATEAQLDSWFELQGRPSLERLRNEPMMRSSTEGNRTFSRYFDALDETNGPEAIWRSMSRDEKQALYDETLEVSRFHADPQGSVATGSSIAFNEPGAILGGYDDWDGLDDEGDADTSGQDDEGDESGDAESEGVESDDAVDGTEFGDDSIDWGTQDGVGEEVRIGLPNDGVAVVTRDPDAPSGTADVAVGDGDPVATEFEPEELEVLDDEKGHDSDRPSPNIALIVGGLAGALLVVLTGFLLLGWLSDGESDSTVGGQTDAEAAEAAETAEAEPPADDQPDEVVGVADEAESDEPTGPACDEGGVGCEEVDEIVVGDGCLEGDADCDVPVVEDCTGVGCDVVAAGAASCNFAIDGECLEPPLAASVDYDLTVSRDGDCGWPPDTLSDQLYLWPYYVREGDTFVRREPGYSLLGLPNSVFIQFRGEEWIGGNEPRGDEPLPTMENTMVDVDLETGRFTLRTDETRFDDGVGCTQMVTYDVLLADPAPLEYLTLVPRNEPPDDIDISGSANYDGTTFTVDGAVTGIGFNQADLHLECSGLDLYLIQLLAVPLDEFVISHPIPDCIVVNFSIVVNGNRVGAGSVSAPADE